MIYNTNFTDISLKLLNITDTLHLNYNIPFKKYFFDFNIITHSDLSNNYYINLNHTNYTYIINNITYPGYSKHITKIDKNNNITVFHSEDHNLKINDIIYFNNFNSLFNFNFINKFILFKITHITNNTFSVISYNYIDNSINNLYDIVHSSALVSDISFDLISDKTFTRIQSVEKFNKIYSLNHQLQLNNVIKLININYNNQNILFDQFTSPDNLFIVTSIIDNNTFQITHYISGDISTDVNANNIFNLNTSITYGFFKVHKSNYLHKNINFILPNNNSTSYGYSYDIIIDDTNLSGITIKTTNSDKLIGFSKFSSQDITGSDFIYTSSDVSTSFSISGLDITQSKFTVTNISKNIWFLKSYIYNNIFKYTITYDNTSNSILFNNTKLTNPIPLYINFSYHFDISHTSLVNNSFIITNDKYINFFKNILVFGKCGILNSKVIFYIDNTFSNNTTFNIKYKNTNFDTIKYSTSIFGVIRNFNNVFNNTI